MGKQLAQIGETPEMDNTEGKTKIFIKYGKFLKECIYTFFFYFIRKKVIKIAWNSIDKTGQKFNMLTAVERLPNYKGNGKTYYKCKCDCGNFHYVSNDNFGKTYSCGCVNKQSVSQRKDYTGEKFNNLTVTKMLYNSNFAYRFCLCTLKIQYLAVSQLSRFCCHAA